MDLEPWAWSIGISDLLNFRECPARFLFNMRRHLELPEEQQLWPGERDDPPESTNWTNALGSASHHAIFLVETQAVSHERAVHGAMQEYGTYLTPDDMVLLREFLDVYERRRPLGVTLVAAERDMRVPLFVHEGQQIYFRFKLDALYRLIANPSVFIHVDYKSSGHRKTPKEVHEDPQAWSYNWAIHERWPECHHLIQHYSQLRFNDVTTTKNDQQRADVKAWLIDNVKLLLAEDIFRPKMNKWCRFCPLVVTCREPRRAVDYTRAKLAVLAPLTKEGRKVRVEFAAEGDELEEIIRDEMPRIIEMRKHAEHVEKEMKAVIGDMPIEERERVGWLLKERRTRSIAPDGLRELHRALGDSFYELASISVSRLEELVGKPKRGEPLSAELQIARDWQVEEVTGSTLQPAKSDD